MLDFTAETRDPIQPRMTPERWQRVRAALDAVRQASPDERPAVLQRQCGEDHHLRAEIESLLAHDGGERHFLDAPPPLPTSIGPANVPATPRAMPDAQALGLIGRQVGGYRIKAVIGSGGMGTVFEAVQAHPRRAVALKIMRIGLASRTAARRFEYEGQLLGRLHHPGIAQIFEAGIHDDSGGGMPYFAMEYIPNAKSIIEYADERKLSTRERLELAAKVCDAVHHGHQKGIIHRDLKPANILVDSTGQPKVIDFGVARATDSDLAVTTQQTDIGQLIGTVQYMSPEQVDADPHDIDTRSDVYSLGVVLYELLTGQLPYDAGGSTIYKATRAIKEDSPRKLSSINRMLRGDVETIVLKALEKDRNRRYRSAADLQDDINHYLRGEAIAARPPSAWYQLKMIAARHKGAAAGVALLIVALVAGLIVTTALLERARRAERDASQVVTLLESAIRSADPELSEGKSRKDWFAGLLVDLSSQIHGASLTNIAEATLRNMIGETLYGLGDYDAAASEFVVVVRLREEALGTNHADTGSALNNLGIAKHYCGDYSEADKSFKRALAILEAAVGLDHPETQNVLNNWGTLKADMGEYSEADRMLRDVVERRTRTLGPESAATLVSMNNFASVLDDIARYDEARALYEQVLAVQQRTLGERNPDTLTTWTNLALVLHNQGEFEQAEAMNRRVWESKTKVLAGDHPSTLISASNLATDLMELGRFDEAGELLQDSLAIQKQMSGELHGDTLRTLNNIGVWHVKQKRFQEAVPIYRECLAGCEQTLGPDKPQTLNTRANLAQALGEVGELVEAEQLGRSVLERRTALLGASHPATLISAHNLAILLAKMQQFDEAEALAEDVLAKRTERFGSSHPDTIDSVETLRKIRDERRSPASQPQSADRAE